MFAPRASARFTRRWFQPMPRTGATVYGGCAFWAVLVYIYAALRAVQVALWLVVVAVIWTAQLACLPVMAVRAVSSRYRP